MKNAAKWATLAVALMGTWCRADSGAFVQLQSQASALGIEFQGDASVSMRAETSQLLPHFAKNLLRNHPKGPITLAKDLFPGETVRLDWARVPSESQWNEFLTLYGQEGHGIEREFGLVRMEGTWFFIQGDIGEIDYGPVTSNQSKLEIHIHSHPYAQTDPDAYRPSPTDLNNYKEFTPNSFAFIFDVRHGFTPYALAPYLNWDETSLGGLFLKPGVSPASCYKPEHYIIIPARNFRNALVEIDVAIQQQRKPARDIFLPFLD